MKKDSIHYLAVDLLDIAVRCHFTKTGIDAFEAKLREHLEPKVETSAPVVETGEPAPAPVKRTRKPKA